MYSYAPQDILVLNVTSGNWSYIEPVKNSEIPEARRDSTIQYDRSTSRVIMFGGKPSQFFKGKQVYPNSVYIYNMASSTWTSIPSISTINGRTKIASILLKNRYFITFYGKRL